MSESVTATALARIWIEAWNDGDPDSIPLAEAFTHSSPFGRVSGRQTYLDWVKPLAAKNVTELKIHRVMGNDEEAVIHFEMETPNGPVQVCDWVEAANGEITQIHSFYDATGLRGT